MLVHAPYPLAETRVEREAHAAQVDGWEVDVVALTDPGEPPEETGADGIRIIRLPQSRTRSGSIRTLADEYLGFTVRAAITVLRLHRKRRYSVIQVHNPPDFLIAAGLIPRLMGAKIILDIHDFAPELFALRFGTRSWGSVATKALALVERAALRLADGVVTVHEPYKRALTARGVPVSKITVALNAPEDDVLPPPSRRRRENGFRVVYHGTLTEHYGIATLLDAVSDLRDDITGLTVEIYGQGDALEGLRRQAAALGLDDIVTFSDGFIDNRLVLEHVAGADAGVVANLPIPRNHTALPTKLFEYAALGVPVVSSRLDAVVEYFSDEEVRYFEGGDARSLAAALRSIAHDPDGARAQAERAHRRYEAYRWSRSSAGYLALLRSLASS